jgi:Lon protease-like protein
MSTTIPLFPLSNALFPAGVMHLRIFEVRYLDMIKKCIANGTEFGVVALVDGQEVRSPEGRETFVSTGTMARVDEWRTPMPAVVTLTCIGTTRFELGASEQLKYGLWMGHATPIEDDPIVAVPEDLQPCADALGRWIAKMQRRGVPAAQMPIAPPFRLDESGWVADRWCELLPMPPEKKGRLLSCQDPISRLEQVYDLLADRGLMP